MDKSFGSLLWQLCVERKMAPKAVAARAGVSREYFDQMIDDTVTTPPGADLLDHVADALTLHGMQRRNFFDAAGLDLEDQAERLFWRVLVQLCEERNILMETLVERSGLTSRCINALMRGWQAPNIDDVKALADALDLYGETRRMFFRSGGYDFIDETTSGEFVEFRIDEDEAEELGIEPLPIPIAGEIKRVGVITTGAWQSTFPLPSPLKIFYCYAHEDKLLRDELEKHLGMIKRLGRITQWYDREIQAGTEWEREIEQHLDAAHIILLLISPDFIHSDYCYGIEMQKALELHLRGRARVIPILMRPVDWRGAPFAHLQILPSGAKPVNSSFWHSRDEALYDVAQGIRVVVEQYIEQPGTTHPTE